MLINYRIYLLQFLFLFVMLFVTSLSAYAQICVSDLLQINSVEGKIVLRNQTPIEGVKIQLLRGTLPKTKLIDETVSDKNGIFQFKKVPTGNYGLVIEDVEGLVDLAVAIQVKKLKPNATPHGVKIGMALILTGHCSNAEVLILDETITSAVPK